MTLEIVIPTEHATFSMRASGRPAIHAAVGKKTLCGKNPDGWAIIGGATVEHITCFVCLRVLAAQFNEEATT